MEISNNDNVLSSRINLAKWFYDIHNKVNEKLDVDHDTTPSFETFYNRYEMYRAECGKQKQLGCTKSDDSIKKQSIIQIVDDDGNDYKLDNNSKDLNDVEILTIFSRDNDTTQLHLVTSKTKELLRKQATECIEYNIGDIQKAKCILDTI